MDRFTDNGNGTVTDNKTGLVWLRNANHFNQKIPWEEARKTCAMLDIAGKGWRLPERMELESLLDLTQSNPALPMGHPFINVQSSYYWSATTYADGTSRAWIVGMTYGYVDDYNKAGNYYYVWPVRAGQ